MNRNRRREPHEPPLIRDIPPGAEINDRGFVATHGRARTLIALDALAKHWPKLAERLEEGVK